MGSGIMLKNLRFPNHLSSGSKLRIPFRVKGWG